MRCGPCGSGRAREHRRSRCHAPRCILRGLARSHRNRAWPRVGAIPVEAMALPKDLEACTGRCGSGRAREHRRSRCHAPRCILRGHARSHRDRAWPRVGVIPVKAMALPKDREACTGRCGSGRAREHRRSRCHAPRYIRRAGGLCHACLSASTNCALVMVERPLMSLLRASFIRLCLLWVSRELPDVRE